MKDLESLGLRLVATHILKVQSHMTTVLNKLNIRSIRHDQSKYHEKEIGLVLGKPKFDKYEYMSKEERQALNDVKESIVHHYAINPHHPEHYKNGINGMSLLDLIEMACDWKAAGEMSLNGSFQNSIEFNTERFNMSPQLVNIFVNTGKEMGWIE